MKLPERTSEKSIERSASHFLCEDLPDGWRKWPEEKLFKYLEDNAWGPFENYQGKTIWKYITNGAESDIGRDIVESLYYLDIECRECDVCKRVFVRGGYFYMAGTIACSETCRNEHLTETRDVLVSLKLVQGLPWPEAFDELWMEMYKNDPSGYYWSELEQ